MSEQEKAVRLKRLEYAWRRKKEKEAAEREAGLELPRYLHKGQSKIDLLLSKENLDAYHTLLRQPATTVKIAAQWLAERGVFCGTEAIRRHRARFLEREANQREAVELAFVFAETARSRGSACMADAAAAFVEQKVMISLMRGVNEQPQGEEFDAKRWQEIYKVLGGVARVRGTIEKIRRSEATAASGEQHARRAGAAKKTKAAADDGARLFRDGSFWKDISPQEKALSHPDPDWKTRPDGHPMENWPREWQEKWFAEAEQILGRPMKQLMPERHRQAVPGQTASAQASTPPGSPRPKSADEICLEVADRMRRILGVPLPHEEAEWCSKYDAEKPQRDKEVAELAAMCFKGKTMEIGDGG